MSREVQVAREQFLAELDGVRRTLDRELGWAPRGSRWIVPLAAVAAGFFAASALRRRIGGQKRRRLAAR